MTHDILGPWGDIALIAMLLLIVCLLGLGAYYAVVRTFIR